MQILPEGSRVALPHVPIVEKARIGWWVDRRWCPTLKIREHCFAKRKGVGNDTWIVGKTATYRTDRLL